MTAFTITVLQDDIDHGERRSHTHCPIARAFRREHPDLIGVQVGMTEVFSLDRRGMLPYEARKFVIAFDHAYPVQPFKFEIEMNR